MREPARYLGEHSPLPVSFIPNAGLPLNVNGETGLSAGPEPMARAAARDGRAFGVGIVGGCCGTTPEHIARIVERVRGRRPAPSARPASRR